MNVTALFVELIVVGIGTATWLVLFLGALFRAKFESDLLQDNPVLVGSLTAIVYVLGIVIDRITRDLFIATVEAAAKDKVFSVDRIKGIMGVEPRFSKENLSMELEKFIRAHSESLATKIDYNRSRLRICRAWVLHFALIPLGFLLWNARVGVADLRTTLIILAIGILFLALTLRTTNLLAEDHQKDLLESFEIITYRQQRDGSRG
jgi:hypothetical protein